MKSEILLLKDVENLGHAGDAVEAANGYIRNYLLPQGLAIPMTEQAKRRQAKIQAEREAARKAEIEAAKKIAEPLAKAQVTIKAKVNEGEDLYGSVDAAQIAEALKLQGFQEVEAKMVVLADVIKKVGDYDVEIKLDAEVSATVKVWVVSDAE